MCRKHRVILTFAFFIGMLGIQVGCGFLIGGVSSTANYDTLALRFYADRDRVQNGDSIYMRFTVTNHGNQSWVLETNASSVMDIIVEESGGGTLLSWSAQNPDKLSRRIEWMPGESKVIELIWVPKPGDIYIGYRHDIHLSGILSGQFGGQGASVTICASDVCR